MDDVNARNMAEAINSSWQKTTESMLYTATLCAQACKVFTGSARGEFIQTLKFSAPTFSKLAKIGEQERLQSDTVRKLLPSGFTIAYELSLLTETDFEAALAESLISPDLTRNGIIDWKRRRNPIPPKAVRIFGHIKFLSDVEADTEAKLRDSIVSLLEPHQATFVEHLDPLSAASGRANRNSEQYIRKEARDVVKKRKIRAKKGNKGWHFAPDEVEITNRSSPDDVRAVLELIGEGDQFDRIHKEAMESFDDEMAAASERYRPQEMTSLDEPDNDNPVASEDPNLEALLDRLLANKD